jgi:ABC-type lipoprotein release transport system permease subunit
VGGVEKKGADKGIDGIITFTNADGDLETVLVSVGTGAGLTLTLLAILALRSVVVPTRGISVYRPTADPLALATIAAFMAMVGLAAAYLPARRAALVDPLVALRRD